MADKAQAIRIPIDENYMCDGHYAVLLSYSLGGSNLTPDALATTLRGADADGITKLLQGGVCLPIFFGGDCALDRGTTFVIGELDEKHKEAWIRRLTSKLSIPCGKLVLLTGGGIAEDIEQAISGRPGPENYCIYQVIDVPPGDYRVDVFAYLGSVTVYLMELDWDGDESELEERFGHLPKVEENYIVQLTPLREELPLPSLVDEINWPGMFEPRGA